MTGNVGESILSYNNVNLVRTEYCQHAPCEWKPGMGGFLYCQTCGKASENATHTYKYAYEGHRRLAAMGGGQPTRVLSAEQAWRLLDAKAKGYRAYAMTEDDILLDMGLDPENTHIQDGDLEYFDLRIELDQRRGQ